MDFLTTDLCDEFGDRVQILSPGFRSYGGLPRFAGPIATLKLFEDNSKVREILGEPGRGRVLVVDGGGSLRCALVGDQLGDLAVRNGWNGIIVYGCIRDSVALGKLPLGIRALDTHPLKSVKKDIGERELPVVFGGVAFRPGEWLYADEDGVIVSPEPLV